MAKTLGTILKEALFKQLFRNDPSYNGQFPSALRSKTNNIDANYMYSAYMDFIRVNQERKVRYREYENMDTDTVASALDLYADDATQMNLKDSESFYVNCENEEVKDILNDLYFNTLSIDEHLWSIVRTFAKYGDYFIRPVGEKGVGIQFVDYSIHPERVTRIDYHGAINHFILDESITLNPWEMVHFKLPGAQPFGLSGEYQPAGSLEALNKEKSVNTYGLSTLEKARKPWKQQQLQENSLILARLARSMKRNVFSVNTTGLTETAAWDLVDKISDLLKTNKFVDPTNSMSMSSAMMNPEEDIVLPVSGEKGSITAQELGGDVDIQHIADVDYINNKLFASLKTPKAYLGFEESLNGRNTLRMLDVRYARTIKNLQRVEILGLERLGRIHLSLLGRDPYGVDFHIGLPYISTIEEAERSEVLSNNSDTLTKVVSLIDQLDEKKSLVNRVSLIKYVLREVGIDDEDIESLLSQPGDTQDV